MKRKSKLLIICSIAILASFATASALTPLDPGSGFMPTPAFSKIIVQTSPWAGFDANVTSDNYNDFVYFVSDGSVKFNVTETYP